MGRLLTGCLALALAACGSTPTPATVEGSETSLPENAPTPPAEGEESKAEVKFTEADDAPTVAAEAREAVDEGAELAAEGDLGGAEQAFREALKAQPNLAEAAYNLGILAEWQGRYDEAARQYEAALQANPEFGPAVVAAAYLRLREGDAPGALRMAEQALSAKPDSKHLRNAVNTIRLELPGRSEQVVQDSKKVLREDEKNVQAMINLASAYHQQGKYELAVAILENALALDPENPEILSRMALAQVAMKDDVAARVTLEKAAALTGGATAEIYNNLGVIYHAAGDYAGAEQQFRRALARWPHMLSAQVNLGNSLKGQQRFDDADKALQDALKIDPRSPDALYNLGILYLDGNLQGLTPVQRLERALKYFEEYKQAGGTKKDDPVELYIQEATKKIEVEKKREAQMRNAPKAPEAPAEGDDGEEGGDEGGDDGAGDDGGDEGGDEATGDDGGDDGGDDAAGDDAVEEEK